MAFLTSFKGARITAEVVRVWLSRYALSQSRRPVKVEAAAITRYVMNTIVVCIIAALWIFPNAYDLDWVKVVAPIGASLYLSCYFWLLSHPRIVAQAFYDPGSVKGE